MYSLCDFIAASTIVTEYILIKLKMDENYLNFTFPISINEPTKTYKFSMNEPRKPGLWFESIRREYRPCFVCIIKASCGLKAQRSIGLVPDYRATWWKRGCVFVLLPESSPYASCCFTCLPHLDCHCRTLPFAKLLNHLLF